MSQTPWWGTISRTALALSLALLVCLSWRASAENVLVLKDAFIQTYKNRATIQANYIIDKAHKKPNAPSKDADIHIAGRAPDDIGLATVAEIMNAAEQSDAVDAVHAAEGTGQRVKVVGVCGSGPSMAGTLSTPRVSPWRPSTRRIRITCSRSTRLLNSPAST